MTSEVYFSEAQSSLKGYSRSALNILMEIKQNLHLSCTKQQQEERKPSIEANITPVQGEKGTVTGS